MQIDWEGWVSIVGGTAAAAISLAKIWKSAKPRLSLLVDGMFATRKILNAIDGLKTQVASLEKEIRPNGGSSLRDAVNRIESRQLAHQARQKAMLSDMDVAVFESDSLGRCQFINRKYSRLIARMPSEVMGHGWINTIAPEDRDRVSEDWKNAVVEERDSVLEYSVMTSSGERIQVRAHAERMTDEAGRTIGYFGTVRPID